MNDRAQATYGGFDPSTYQARGNQLYPGTIIKVWDDDDDGDDDDDDDDDEKKKKKKKKEKKKKKPTRYYDIRYDDGDFEERVMVSMPLLLGNIVQAGCWDGGLLLL